MRPLSMVKDKGFRKMISILEPQLHAAFKNLLHEIDEEKTNKSLASWRTGRLIALLSHLDQFCYRGLSGGEMSLSRGGLGIKVT